MQQNFWKENSIMSSWQNLRCHIVWIYIEACPHLFILDMPRCNELKQCPHKRLHKTQVPPTITCACAIFNTNQIGWHRFFIDISDPDRKFIVLEGAQSKGRCQNRIVLRNSSVKVTPPPTPVCGISLSTEVPSVVTILSWHWLIVSC